MSRITNKWQKTAKRSDATANHPASRKELAVLITKKKCRTLKHNHPAFLLYTLESNSNQKETAQPHRISKFR
jgi:hypothetical protein